MIRSGYRRRLLMLAIACLPATLLPAIETELFDAPVSSDTRKAVSDLLASMAESEVMSGRFTQEKQIHRLNRSFLSSGTFFFSSGNGIIWTVLEPFPSETILTSDAMIQIMPDGTRSVMDASDNRIFRSFSSAMLSVFSGDYEALEQHFRLYYLPERSPGEVGLVPVDTTVSAVIESLVLSGNGDEIRLLLTESGDDTIEYLFLIEERREALVGEEQNLFR